jgi:hypothetical protein
MDTAIAMSQIFLAFSEGGMNDYIGEDCLIIKKENPKPNLDEILDSIPNDFEYPEDIADFVNSESFGNELI